MPRILIIGAGGFLGSRLVTRLTGDTTFRTIGVGRSKRPESHHGDWVQVDVIDLPMLQSIINKDDIIINCSGIVSYNPADDEEMLKVNEDGTNNLVIASLDAKVAHFIHISSIAVFGQRVPGEVISEKNMWIKSPDNSQYAISKFKSEQQVWRGIQEGLKATLLNPSFILGGFQNFRSSAKIIKTIHHNNRYHPRGSNGFVDVDDVVNAVLAVIEGQYSGERFIINGQNLSYADLYRMASASLNIPFDSKPLPTYLERYLPILDAIRSLVTGKKREIFRDTVKASRRQRSFNNSKSTNVLGLSYRPIETTIKNTVDAYLKTLS